MINLNFYREQLNFYLKYYLDKTIEQSIAIASLGAREKADIVVQRFLLPGDKEVQRDYNKIVDKIGYETRSILHNYNRAIMILLGQICECIVINKCKVDRGFNRKCINYACFKEDIFEEYCDIEYDRFTPFSPSHKKILLYSDSGIIYFKENLYSYEPNHVNKDIIWCNRKHIEETLKTNFGHYSGEARLQIKASIDYNNVIKQCKNEKYMLSPIIYFDMNRDARDLQKYVFETQCNLFVKSIIEFDQNLMEECVKYYKLLAGYFCGLIEPTDVTDIDLKLNGVLENAMLKYIFNADICSLLSDRENEKNIQLRNIILKSFERGNTPKQLVVLRTL